MSLRGMLPTTIFLLALSIFSLTLFNPSKSHSVAGHLVISEVQAASASSVNDEFVELYNPTESSISLEGLQLARKTASATTPDELVATLSGTIDSHHFFLIANPAATLSATPDVTFSNTTATGKITDNNTIILYASDHTTIIDEVGYGSAGEKETTAHTPTIPDGKSVERKALSTSTIASMTSAGTDELLGNGEDTNNNANDFIVRNTPQPQNSSSPAEPVDVTPTPTGTVTPTASPTPTVTPTGTPTPTPTTTPSPTPTSTPSPTSTPTPTVTPTPTNTPTPTMTVTPSPTAVLSPTVTPTVTPTPIPNPVTDVFGYFNAVMKQIQNNFKFYFPFLKF